MQPRWVYRSAIGCSLVVAGGLVGGTASGKLSRTGQPSATFLASGPGGLKIEGKTNELEVRDGDTVVIVVPLAHLTTGIDLRDKHMREKYLEVEKYPDAELDIPRQAIRFPAAGQRIEGAQATGTLRLHGQTKPMSFHYNIAHEGNQYHVDGGFGINIEQFGIAQPAFMGVTVKPDMTVAVSFNAVDS